MSIPNRLAHEVSLTIPMTSFHQPAQPGESSQDLLILLHGYQDSAESLWRRCLPEGPLPFHVLAPNSPFPAPIRTNDGFREAYSWFFADRSKGQVLLPPLASVEALTQLVSQLGLSHHRKILVGFSQGGYFAPFAARKLENVVKIIGVGSGYRAEDYEGLQVDDIDAIHGDRDDVIEIDRARKGYEELRPKLAAGEFHTLPGLKHGIDSKVRTLLMEKIGAKFGEGV